MKLSQLQKRANRGLSTDRSTGPHAITKSQGPFSSLGEQLSAIRRAYTPGSYGWTDPRLLDVNRRAEQRAQPAGSSEMIPADGGFLLQPEWSAAIMQRAYNVGDVFRRCAQRTITSDTFRYSAYDEQSRAQGSRLGGVRVYAINEADTLTLSKPRLKASEIKTNKIIGLLEATSELVADANSYGEQMEEAFALELCFAIENYVITGDGADVPQGILNSPALITVPKQSGQASGSLIYANVEQMISSLWARSFQSDATIWLYNQALLPQLASLATIVGTAGSESKAWQWAQYPEDDDTLCGFSAIPCEYCAIPGQVSDILLVDLSRYLLVVRELLRSEVSIHVAFLSDQQLFRFICRIGGSTIDHTPVLPANGSQTTSSFVTLASR